MADCAEGLRNLMLGEIESISRILEWLGMNGSERK